MASLTANVRIEHCRACGSILRTQSGKGVCLELKWAGATRKLELLVNLQPKQVTIPLAPPLMMTTAHIGEGRLGLNLPNVRLHPTADPVMLQVMLAEADPVVLVKLRDAVNTCMSRILRKPLQPLSQNIPSCSAGSLHSSGVGSKRKAGSMCGPASTCNSSGSRRGLGDDATSKRHLPKEEELAELSSEQRQIVDLVIAGKNVFFTGCAGTGKSLVLKHILRALPDDSTFVTASTGLAACALGGITLHAFAGVGRCSDVASALLKASRLDARQRWNRATTLIVDEVSMVDGDFLDMIEEVARRVRGSSQPFGGLQVVLSGDFHQLPPVVQGAQAMQQRRFCFESAAWRACKFHCLQLTRVFRQSDNEFVKMLAEVRSGSAPAEVVARLQQMCREPVNVDGIVATKLFTHREDVDALNISELKALPGETVTFTAQNCGPSPASLDSGCPARQRLEIKVRAQVMLNRNVSASRGLVNGARGVVERFVGTTNRLPVVRFANGVVTTVSKERWSIASGGKLVASRTQLPLELGWAMSIHKCQGLTLDAVQINLERAFEPGMAYVSLSRVRSLEGLQIVGAINPRALQAHPKVVQFYAQLMASEDHRALQGAA